MRKPLKIKLEDLRQNQLKDFYQINSNIRDLLIEEEWFIEGVGLNLIAKQLGLRFEEE